MVRYKFYGSGSVLRIYGGRAVKKADFQKELSHIRALHKTKPIFRRSDRSLVAEWAIHNALRSADKTDCDFDYPSDRPEWFNRFLGALVWPFIK